MNFFNTVYEVVKKISVGKVATYGDIAKAVGNPRASRAVGWALHSNPYEGIVPCHRVVNAKGELSKAFVFGGIHMQRELLEKEGICFDKEGRVDMEKHRITSLL